MSSSIPATPVTAAILLTLGLLAGWGCSVPQEDPPPPEERPEDPSEDEDNDATRVAGPQDARADMIDTASTPVGTIVLEARQDREVHLEGILEGLDLPPGPKGFHVHGEGQCDPPDFESAGPHFNPHDTPHGGPEDPPNRRHVGDLGNVEVGPGGRVEVDLVDSIVSLEAGAAEDVRGRSLVLHGEEDDLVSQPAGNAGDRVACGVIR